MMLVVYTAPLLRESDIDRALSALPPSFGRYAGRKPQGRLRRQAVSWLWLLCAAFARERSEAPPDALETDARGKPSLCGAGVWISASHAGELAAVALGSGPCGVDIERLVPPREGIERKICAAAECAAIAAAPDEAARGMLRLCYFVAKEAALKRLGEGFHRDPRSIALVGPPQVGLSIPLEGAGEGARIELWEQEAGGLRYLGAVCHAGQRVQFHALGDLPVP